MSSESTEEVVTTRWPILRAFRERLKSPRFWILLLSFSLATAILIAGVALAGVKNLTTPPAVGEFSKVLLGEPQVSPTNITDTLFEDTVDKLSGGGIPVLLFPNSTNFCGDNEEEWDKGLRSGACVDPFNPTHIALSEELSQNFDRNYFAALEAGLTPEAELINQWERHIAAHEFAHVLQYNFQEISLPYEKSFEGGFLGRTYEDMAECYAQLLYPMNDEIASKNGEQFSVEFYNFPEAERFALCTPKQLSTIEKWLQAIPYPQGVHTN